jgi:antitoxin component of MazEF toxin-antitoxin module
MPILVRRIDNRNRLPLPPAALTFLNLHPGDFVELDLDHDRVSLYKLTFRREI